MELPQEGKTACPSIRDAKTIPRRLPSLHSRPAALSHFTSGHVSHSATTRLSGRDDDENTIALSCAFSATPVLQLRPAFLTELTPHGYDVRQSIRCGWFSGVIPCSWYSSSSVQIGSLRLTFQTESTRSGQSIIMHSMSVSQKCSYVFPLPQFQYSSADNSPSVWSF